MRRKRGGRQRRRSTRPAGICRNCSQPIVQSRRGHWIHAATDIGRCYADA